MVFPPCLRLFSLPVKFVMGFIRPTLGGVLRPFLLGKIFFSFLQLRLDHRLPTSVQERQVGFWEDSCYSYSPAHPSHRILI